MRFTMKRTLALALALMLAMPTFAFADGAAEAQDANGQITANELVLNDSPVLDDDLLLDGDLVLDDLSLDLTQPDDPTGDLELGSQDPSEGDAGEQPDASEAGTSGESPLELGDDAQVTGEEIPDPQPLMLPEYAVDVALEGENVTDPAMMANDGEQTAWQKLSGDFGSASCETIHLTTDCIALETDERLVRSSATTLALNLNEYTINRNRSEAKENGNVIYTPENLTIYGSGKITGGKTVSQNGGNYGGGGIEVSNASTLTLNEGVEITGNHAYSAGSWGCGGGVYLGESGSSNNKNKLKMNNTSAIKTNTAQVFGGGVFLAKYAELEMKDDASISGNEAAEGGGVVVDEYASFSMNDGAKITGNHANYTNNKGGFGGGVSVRKGSTFTMAKGEITDNHAKGNIEDGKGGGGVYVGGTFTMTGGTIKENTVDNNGGGVYVDGTFNIGKYNDTCTITITGNKKGNAANNVYLPANKKITVVGQLTEDSIIGVTTEKKPNGTDGYIPITWSFPSSFVDEGKVFQSDDTHYEVGVIPKDNVSEKKLGLGVVIKHKAEDVSVPYDGKDHGLKVNVTVPSDSDQTVVKYKGTTGLYDKTENPTFKQVGIYTVEYEISNSDKVSKPYCFPVQAKHTVTITPVVSIEGWTYGQSPNTPTVDQASLPYGASTAYEYFTDEACTKTTTSADGASAAGGQPKYARTYYVRATVTVDSDKIPGKPTEFTIAPAKATVKAKDTSKAYGEKDPTLEATVSGLVNGDTASLITYTLSRAEGENAGTYAITPAGNTAQGNYEVTFKTGTLTINPKTLNNDDLVITLDPAEYTYDGTEKKPAVTVKDKKTSQVVPAKEYSVDYRDNVNAGTAKVTITDVKDGNYTVSGVKTFTINKAAMTVSASGYDGKYDGKAHGIIVIVTTPTSGYTVEYGTAEGTYGKDNPTYTDAGVYTVYYQVTATNHETVTGSAKVEITAIDDNLDITLSQTEYTYDGTEKKPAVTVTDKDTQQVVPASEYNVAYRDNVNAGTATVTISDKTGGNYKVNGVKTFTINKAAMKVSASGYDEKYDGEAHGITVNVTDPKSGYTVEYGTKEGTYGKDNPTYTDAGVYTVYYKVTAENYKTVTGSATVEITARELDNDPDGDGSEDADGNVIITLDPAEYTYDGTAKEPAVTVKDKKTSQVVPAKEYSVDYRDNVNAGTAKVTISDKTGGNYKVNGVKTFTINKAAMKVSASGYDEKYDGKAHGITVNVTEPKTGYTVEYGTKEGTYGKDNPTYTDIGVYTVYYKVTAENYKTVTGSATVEITAKELDNDPDGDGSEDDDSNVVITLDPAEYTYDGTPKEPAVTVKDKDTKQVVPAGEYKVTYSDNVNAGTAKVTISDVKGGNYAVSGVKTFTIKKAAMTVSASGYKGEYDGKAHGITVKVTDPKDGYTVKYGEKEGTYDKNSLTYTDTGVYTVYYKVIATNYVPVTGSANVEITAKEDKLTIKLGKSEYTYNGEAKRPSVTVKYDGKVVSATEYKVTYSNNKHAGTAKVTISDVSGGQYTVNGNKTFTILPKTVGLKWKSTAFVYDGDEHVPTAKAMGLVKKDKCKVSVSGAATEAGNHTARATKLSNPDYALPKDVTRTFIISSRGSGSSDSGNARFVAESKTGTKGIGTVTYNGKTQEPTFEVKCIFNVSNGLASNTVLTVPASEYRVTYRDNVDVGKATVEVTDVPGGNYVVNFRTEFTIARRKVTVTAKDQDVKTVDDVKTGVKAVKVQGLIKGHVLESVKLDVDIKADTKKGRIIPGKAKIVDAEGKDVTKNYKFDYLAGSLAVAQKYDPEPKPAKPDFTLLAQMKTCGHRALRVTWTRVPEADGYELAFVKEGCSSKKAKVVTVRGQNTWKFTGLEKNTAYMAIVRAWKNDGDKRTFIGKSSPVVCAITGDVGKHNTNAGSVRPSVSRLKLNVGKKAKVKTAVKGVKSGKDVMRWDHALLRWYSDNANVATVNAKGEIRAVAAGECTVYALAANGKKATVKVKVK